LELKKNKSTSCVMGLIGLIAKLCSYNILAYLKSQNVTCTLDVCYYGVKTLAYILFIWV
jgi:hypothetical protein